MGAQYLNSIHVRGVVGCVRRNNVCTRFTVCTQKTYRNSEGYVIESTWFNAVDLGNMNKKDLDAIEKGSIIEVKGSMRQVSYISESGEGRHSMEILASEITVYPPETEIDYE